MRRLNKYYKIIAVLLLVTGCRTNGSIVISNSVKLNSIQADMDGYIWLDDQGGVFEEISVDEACRLFEEDGSGILCFGDIGCAYCQRAIPELYKIAYKYCVTVYYIGVYAPWNTAEDYARLFPIIDSVMVSTPQGKVLEIPLIIAVKDGEIVGSHLSLVEDYHMESESSQMSWKQKKKLQVIYAELIKAVGS